MEINIKGILYNSKRKAMEERSSSTETFLKVFLGMEFLKGKADMSGIMGQNLKEYSCEVFAQVKGLFKPQMASAISEISKKSDPKVSARSSCQTETDTTESFGKAKRMEEERFFSKTPANTLTDTGRTTSFSKAIPFDYDLIIPISSSSTS